MRTAAEVPEPAFKKTYGKLQTESLQYIEKGAAYFNVKTRNIQVILRSYHFTSRIFSMICISVLNVLLNCY